MASATTAHADAKTATPHTAEKTPEKANTNLLLAMLAADWVVGDKHHYADIRRQAQLVLTELGKDGEAAKARLEGMNFLADTDREGAEVRAWLEGEMRPEVRAWLADNLQPDTRARLERNAREAAEAKARLVAPHNPVPHGPDAKPAAKA